MGAVACASRQRISPRQSTFCLKRVCRRGMENPSIAFADLLRWAEIFEAPTPDEMSLFDPAFTGHVVPPNLVHQLLSESQTTGEALSEGWVTIFSVKRGRSSKISSQGSLELVHW